MISILIPSRNEEFLKNTVDDILKNSTETEIIIGLDGQWPIEGLNDDKRVTLVYLPQSIGQRAATNMLCRLSKAKYVMKLDAHCSFDKDFDKKMLDAFKETGDDVTMVPVMRNLYVYDWVCPNGHRRYQGPTKPCDKCGKEMSKEFVWRGKESPQSTSYNVNSQLEFGYFGQYKPKQKEELSETMSLQGSCFMCTRENYWKKELCDESWGSWGGQGAEVALKTWLSGGRVICNKRTWYAHLFRTQGEDFGFPYPNPAREQKKAKDTLRDVFLNNKWHKQEKPLSWLVEKFWPVPGWTEKELENIKKVPLKPSKAYYGGAKGILYYTTNTLPIKLAKKVQRNLKGMGLPITSVSLKPMQYGTNIHIPLQPGKWAYFTQIVAGLESMKPDTIVFMCEHDCIYPKEHFDFIPPRKDKFYYNINWYKVHADGKAYHWDAKQVSGLVAYREHLLEHYRSKLDEILKKGFNRSYEPGGRDESKYETWESSIPYIDIRHGKTMTGEKRSPKDFRDKSSCVNWQESNLKELGLEGII